MLMRNLTHKTRTEIQQTDIYKIINFDCHPIHCILTCRYILQIMSKFSHKIQVSRQASKVSKTSYKVSIIFR